MHFLKADIQAKHPLHDKVVHHIKCNLQTTKTRVSDRENPDHKPKRACSCGLPEKQLSAVDSLIDSMMLLEEQDGETVDIFKVNHMANPQFQRLFQVLHQQLLHHRSCFLSVIIHGRITLPLSCLSICSAYSTGP